MLDSPVGEVLRHKFDNLVRTIQIDYPANVAGGDRKVIAAELFEQDRWGRTVTLEKRDLNHHRSTPYEELSVRDYMQRSVLSSTFPYKVEKDRHHPPRGRDPVRRTGLDRGLRGRRRRDEGRAIGIHPRGRDRASWRSSTPRERFSTSGDPSSITASAPSQ